MFVSPDGEQVEPSRLPRRRRHGDHLTEVQVRLVNDILYRLLTVMFGLSPADARRCLARTINPSLTRKRQRDLAPIAAQLGEFAMIIEVIRDVS